ncbi:DEAD/DEAH box helicase [Fodinicola acaciae]|uniref:DEAD/DEAH box helicase n=1 Tax=Fodinicola acaciae TaxID=2681555 RepID=UPI0013D07CC5|nr:DEAD/DEAH box helicase [Fodinicola acaciae]
MRLTPGTEAVFVPAADGVARHGRVAFWGPDVDNDGWIELVLRGRSGIRRRQVPARMVPVQEALPLLLTNPTDASLTVRVWSVAALAGLGLMARGRIVPARTADGYGSWRVGPLDPYDHDWLARMTTAMPVRAYAVPLGDKHIHQPGELVRLFWDALADTFVRTSGAPTAVDAPAFTTAEPAKIAGPLDWLDALDQSEHAGVRVVLRLEVPDDDAESWMAVVQLRSIADPSLILDAEELWHAPAAVVARFGEDAESDLLLALRRGARAWPPMGPILEQESPTAIPLDDESVEDLLGDGAARLNNAGIDVLWPANLLVEEVKLKGGMEAPKSLTEPAMTMRSLLRFSWRPTLSGEVLTEDEIAELAAAKRSLIRLRGRWVKVDRALIGKLRKQRDRQLTGLEALSAALTGEIDVDGETIEFEAAPEIARLADRLSTMDTESIDTPAELRATLRPYQQRGLAWLNAMTELGLGGCLADDMGLGKTIQLIALHLHRKSGPTLVICPTTLLGNWERELAKFAPHLPVRRYHGGQRHLDDLRHDEVVLASYGVVRRDAETLATIDWGLVAADEAQHAKNPLSRTAKSLRRIPAAARLALTGTPVENRLSELWAILDWTTPHLLGSQESFRKKVAIPVERYGNQEATEKLAKVVRPFLLRRKKTDPGIAPELPPKTETDQIVQLTVEQATLYRAIVEEILAQIEEAQGDMDRRGLIFKLLTALKQVCNHPAQYLHEDGPIGNRSGKLAALEELLDVIVAENESVLVFTQYVEMGRLLEKHLAGRGIRTLFLHGGTSPRQRDEMVERFQRGEVPVFLLSLKAGGVGLNLTRASHVIHYDRWWNPAVEDQATDRAYRIGQTKPVQVHKLITEGTVEDRIDTLVKSKRALAEAVVGGGETWLTELSNQELADLVRLGQDVEVAA